MTTTGAAVTGAAATQATATRPAATQATATRPAATRPALTRPAVTRAAVTRAMAAAPDALALFAETSTALRHRVPFDAAIWQATAESRDVVFDDHHINRGLLF